MPSSRILPPHATIDTFAGSLLPGEKDRLEKWSEEKFSHISGFTFAERAAHYGRIYKARFESDPPLGQLFLRQLIHRKPPSIGFHLLARIPALRLVQCPGFTELMVLLDETFNFDPLDEELQQRATKIAADLKSSSAKAKGEVADHQRKLLESSTAALSSDSGDGEDTANMAVLPPPAERIWREWRDAINTSSGREAENEITRQALAALPDSLALQAIAAADATLRNPSDDPPIEQIEKLLRQSESCHGPDHEETLQIMHSLAFAFNGLGDYSQAEALYRRVLSERERVLGPEHPDTLASRHNLSLTLENLGRQDEALTFARRALAGWKKVLGENHPDSQDAKRRVERLEKQ